MDARMREESVRVRVVAAAILMLVMDHFATCKDPPARSPAHRLGEPVYHGGIALRQRHTGGLILLFVNHIPLIMGSFSMSGEVTEIGGGLRICVWMG